MTPSLALPGGPVRRYATATLPGLIWIVIAIVVRAALPPTAAPPLTLPGTATRQLANSLELARPTTSHVWRDVRPLNPDGTVNAYVEIALGDLRKWEFDMRLNARAVDRAMPPQVGGYPVNYGFVPQTISYDGDPFDALVLGPAIDGGTVVRGVIVGLLRMNDEKGLDSKVVLSVPALDGRPVHPLTDADRQRMADYFGRYKRHEPENSPSSTGGTRVRRDSHSSRRRTRSFATVAANQAQPAASELARAGLSDKRVDRALHRIPVAVSKPCAPGRDIRCDGATGSSAYGTTWCDGRHALSLRIDLIDPQ